MRVFSQIDNCQQKQKKKQKKRQNKEGAPLLGLAKSIYYFHALCVEKHLTGGRIGSS